jgi:sugar/nucleoside kinase (ribokinase family)
VPPPTFLAFGDVMLDILVDTVSAPEPHAARIRVLPGGSAANAAVWAAACGADAIAAGRVGSDAAAVMLRRALETRGVASRLAADASSYTGSVLVLGDGRARRVLADRGANARLAEGDLPAEIEPNVLLVSGYVLLQADTGEAAGAVLAASRAEWRAVDTASAALLENFGVERFLAVTEPANAVVVGAAEARLLTGCGRAHEAAATLGERYRLVGVKLGPEGAVAALDGDVRAARSESVETVDETGAGDAFTAAFLVAVARGESLDGALSLAARCGALAAASPGSWPRSQNLAELTD